MAALLYRAKELEILTTTAYTNAMKYVSRRGWRRREPGAEQPREQPALLSKALELLATNGKTLEALAAQGHLIAVDERRQQLGIVSHVRPTVSFCFATPSRNRPVLRRSGAVRWDLIHLGRCVRRRVLEDGRGDNGRATHRLRARIDRRPGFGVATGCVGARGL
jgi:hypothetical protein